MKKRLVSFLFLLSFFAVALYGQNLLKFNDKGAFKIAQLTDIHWDNSSKYCIETKNIIQSVLEAEKPDLIILTGDVVSDAPIREGWMAIAKLFEESQTPWAVVLGNHDAEKSREYSRCEIFDLLEKYPYFMGKKGDEALTGCGNYTLEILDHQKESIVFVLYCIDSNDYPENSKMGTYDWIHFDQVAWYKKKSEEYAQKNNKKPVPACAFFHIAIPEFANIVGKNTTVGHKLEGISSSEVNSGLFAAMLEQKDVKGVFVGHDHENDYIGIEKDIALAFGRVTGADAYGLLERGARIIQLYENDRRFDTWIRTRKGVELSYHYPSGISSEDEELLPLLPALGRKKTKHGVHYTYYEGGKLKHTNDLTTEKIVTKGVLDNFSLIPAQVPDSFGFVFQAYIDIPTDGIYRFYTYSDDGSTLQIDGQMVVDNDGGHSASRVEGKIGLKAGLHELIVRYFENYMGKILEVGIVSKEISEMPVPDNMLYLKE